ncbi:MAG: response regulator transcription factor [Patulibacter sp.]
MQIASSPDVAVATAPRGDEGIRRGGNRDSAIRVLVVSDWAAMCLGFRALLASRPWVERCVSAGTLESAVELAGRYSPHVVILDPAIAEGAGWTAASAVATAAPDARLVVLTTRAISVATARSYGASALLPKNARLEEIAQVVRQVAAGKSHLRQNKVGEAGLSPRECDVLALIAGGRTNREIAAHLVLSSETVKQHATAIYRKLGVRNRTEASRRANELGVTATPEAPVHHFAAA